MWGLMVAAHGFEPRTLRVWTECSSQLSYAAIFIWSWWPGLNWWPYPYQGYALPTELHQHRNQIIKMVAGAGLEPTTFGLWARRATNCSTPRWKLIKKVVERVGFEPTKRNAADLQSAPFSHSGTSPFGAGNRTWTHNLLITSQLLYQLSYASIITTRCILSSVPLSVKNFLKTFLKFFSFTAVSLSA